MPRASRAERADRLIVKTKAAFVQCLLDARDPAHFPFTLSQHPIIRLIDMDAISSHVLRRITGCIRGAEHAGKRLTRFDDGHQTDADANGEAFLLPAEAEGAQ